jgi:hypothetical protein
MVLVNLALTRATFVHTSLFSTLTDPDLDSGSPVEPEYGYKRVITHSTHVYYEDGGIL